MVSLTNPLLLAKKIIVAISVVATMFMVASLDAKAQNNNALGATSEKNDAPEADFGSKFLNYIDGPIRFTPFRVFPETLYFGDQVYIVNIGKNTFSTGIFFEPVDPRNPDTAPFAKFELFRGNEKWDIALERSYSFFRSHAGYADITIGPKQEYVQFADQFCLPPLEDIHDPFWQNAMKDAPPDGVPFVIRMTSGIENGVFRSQIVKIVHRPAKEIKLIEKWYKDTPTDFFPKLHKYRMPIEDAYGDVYALLKLPNAEEYQEIHTHNLPPMSSRYFTTLGNRYPGPPNAPETWQGWKELEESLTPSTMRDEIRLTRILIQYCDTEDDAVLSELKEWFSDMNEIQRTVMAKSLRDRAEGCYGNEKLLPPFREIYKAIREYDVVPVPESKVKHLRNLGLIE